MSFLQTEVYNITSNLTLTGTLASPITVASSSGVSQVIFTLLQGATQDVGYVTSTRMDSSLGQTIWDYKGTLTTTTNWNAVTTAAPSTMGSAFIN
jgi:hypothetical protein